MKKVDSNFSTSSDVLQNWEVGQSMPLDYIAKDGLYKLLEEHPNFKRQVIEDIEKQHFKFQQNTRAHIIKLQSETVFAQIRLAQYLDSFVEDSRCIDWKEFWQNAEREVSKQVVVANKQQ